MTTIVYDTANQVIYSDCRTSQKETYHDLSNKLLDVSKLGMEDPVLGRILVLTGAGKTEQLEGLYSDILEHGAGAVMLAASKLSQVRTHSMYTALIVGTMNYAILGKGVRHSGKLRLGGSGAATISYYLPAVEAGFITLDDAMFISGVMDERSSPSYHRASLDREHGTVKVSYKPVKDLDKAHSRAQRIMEKVTAHALGSLHISPANTFDRKSPIEQKLATHSSRRKKPSAK